MEKKKNPRADIEKRKTGFFLIGLVIALSCSITVINLKWKEITAKDEISCTFGETDDNEIQPRIIREVPKVREKLAIITDVFVIKEPEIIIEKEPEIVLEKPKNAEVGEENFIPEEIIDAPDEIEDPTPVNYLRVEKLPLFENCKHLQIMEEQRACFQQEIMHHISSNFKYPHIEKQMGLEEKIFITFVISKTGDVADIKILRGKNKGFRKEAIRLIESLPKLTPARQRSKAVNMSYSIPINFKLK